MRKIVTLLSLCMFCAMAFAAEVRMDSYAVERLALRSPVYATDAAGRKRLFNEVYIVSIKGSIPAFGARPVQIFIGEEPVREYGSTSDGIYFKVYDPDQLQRWDGKPIRYVIWPGKLQDSGLVFRYERSRN